MLSLFSLFFFSPSFLFTIVDLFLCEMETSSSGSLEFLSAYLSFLKFFVERLYSFLSFLKIFLKTDHHLRAVSGCGFLHICRTFRLLRMKKSADEFKAS